MTEKETELIERASKFDVNINDGEIYMDIIERLIIELEQRQKRYDACFY